MSAHFPHLREQTASCLSRMALLDSCILMMCKAGTVHTLNRGMLANLDNPKLILIGLEIFSNFAAADDDEIDAEATEILLEHGSIETIKTVMDKMFTNESVMLSAFDALYNFSDDAKAAEYLAFVSRLPMPAGVAETGSHAHQCAAVISMHHHCQHGRVDVVVPHRDHAVRERCIEQDFAAQHAHAKQVRRLLKLFAIARDTQAN